MNLALAPSATLSGTVYDPDGAPFKEAVLTFPGTPLDAVNTDGSGFYQISLPIGATYTVHAAGTGIGSRIPQRVRRWKHDPGLQPARRPDVLPLGSGQLGLPDLQLRRRRWGPGAHVSRGAGAQGPRSSCPTIPADRERDVPLQLLRYRVYDGGHQLQRLHHDGGRIHGLFQHADPELEFPGAAVSTGCGTT